MDGEPCPHRSGNDHHTTTPCTAQPCPRVARNARNAHTVNTCPHCTHLRTMPALVAFVNRAHMHTMRTTRPVHTSVRTGRIVLTVPVVVLGLFFIFSGIQFEPGDCLYHPARTVNQS